LKPVHRLAVTAALCLSAAAHAATPAPTERQVVADAGKRANAQPEQKPQVRTKDEAAAKAREAGAPAVGDKGKAEFDFTLHWYN